MGPPSLSHVVPTVGFVDVVAALDAVVAELPDGGEARPGQRQMAAAIEEAIATGRHVVVQAGTGTGKTLAYLVPAILSGRKRIVVATATKALQDQLVDKDLPFLAEHLERPFTYASLKGRANYLCLQRAKEVLGGDEQLAINGVDPLADRAPPGVAAADRVGHRNRDRRPSRPRLRAIAQRVGGAVGQRARVPRRHSVPRR